MNANFDNILVKIETNRLGLLPYSDSIERKISSAESSAAKANAIKEKIEPDQAENLEKLLEISKHLLEDLVILNLGLEADETSQKVNEKANEVLANLQHSTDKTLEHLRNIFKEYNDNPHMQSYLEASIATLEHGVHNEIKKAEIKLEEFSLRKKVTEELEDSDFLPLGGSGEEKEVEITEAEAPYFVNRPSSWWFNPWGPSAKPLHTFSDDEAIVGEALLPFDRRADMIHSLMGRFIDVNLIELQVGDKKTDAPQQFVLDIHRLDNIIYNGEYFVLKKDPLLKIDEIKAVYKPVELVEALRKAVGDNATNKILAFMCQASMAQPLGEAMLLFRDRFEANEFHQQHAFTVANESGLWIDLAISENEVKVKLKTLMSLNAYSNSRDYWNEEFVMKREITIPLKELKEAGVEENFPNLHVVDSFSALVIDDHLSAMKLLQKF
jgi:hypothetical protein